MGLSAWANVEWHGSTHDHLVPLGDGQFCVLEFEEGAQLLADAVRTCNEDRHSGHGRRHSEEDAKQAYHDAVFQLLTRDYDEEMRDLDRKIAWFDKWGWHAPAAVLFPDQDGGWKLLMPDSHGDPVFYDLHGNPIGDDIMPPPEKIGMVKDKQGIGWQRKRRLKGETRLRRLRAKE